jgi:hypothetical protein
MRLERSNQVAKSNHHVTPIPNIERLAVCAGSAAFIGPLAYGDAPPAIEQLCGYSDCPYRDDTSHQGRGLPQPDNDLQMEVELCYGCAAVMIPAGSRWSLFYCDPCAEMVRELARNAGDVLLPFGRHSIMNRISLSGASAVDPHQRAAFADASMGMFARIDRLYAWRALVVAERIEVIQPGARSVAAQAYLAHCARHAPSRPDMFRQLCRYFGIEGVV